jgi:uncharacterized protein with HEPN domain
VTNSGWMSISRTSFMRNRVSHGYFSVDLEIVWKAIQRDIPELEQQVKHLHIR